MRTGLFWTHKDEELGEREMIVPLQDVRVYARLETGLSFTHVQLTYQNILSNEAVDVRFEYPYIKN